MSAASAPITRVIISDRVCLPNESRTSLLPAVIRVDVASGRISSIKSGAEAVSAARGAAKDAGVEVIDAGSLVVMSGLVDTHVHCNEPGRTDWEGLETATRAAAAGGVTTIVDMPLNSIPPTTTMVGLKAKEEAAVGKLSVDLGLWGGIIPSNLHDLKELAAGGVCGFKCFMIESGVDEFPCVSEEELRAAMQEVKKSCPTLPVLCHAEACAAHNHPKDEGHHNEYHSYLHSRPTRFETDAITTAIKLAEETGAKTHVVHLSAAEGISLFADAHKRGAQNVTVETCPHYLTLDAESIPSGATAFKCAPPIREKSNQSKLWAGLRAGTISIIVSDHSPCEPSLKLLDSGDFSKAWGGISSLQLGLPLIFSELRSQALAAGASDVSKVESELIVQLNHWMSEATAKFVSFNHRKGALKEGFDADITIWDPSATFLIEKGIIQHKHKLTPYLGKTLYGVVQKTILRGKTVYEFKADSQEKQVFPGNFAGERIRPSGHPLEEQRLKQ